MSAQQSIPYQRMYPDGVCRVTDRFYSKTIQYQDINYQLAQAEDQEAIFELWCEYLNYFDTVVKGQRIELAVILGAFYGLRRSEIVGIKWDAIDFERKTFTIKHTVTQVMLDGKVTMIDKERTKTKSSHRTLPLVKPFEELLIHMKAEQEINRRVCGSAYCKDYLDYIYVNELGDLVTTVLSGIKCPSSNRKTARL